MNKQELIEKIEALPDNIGLIRPHIDKKVVLGLVRQLDEPQKVVVPKFVADWYEKHKDNLEYNIWEYILHWGKQQKSEFYEWMNRANNKPFQTLANMHQFGYEVEKEKRYLVKLKGVVCNSRVLRHNINEDTWFMSNEKNYTDLKSYHTRKELEEAGFGWVFDCEGIEIREVTE